MADNVASQQLFDLWKKQMEEGAEKPKLKSTFQKGDKVRVKL